VAGPGIDHIRPGAAMDDVIARARDNPVGGGRSRDGQRRRHRTGVEILEVRDADGIAGCLVHAGGNSEVDRGDTGAGVQDQGVGARAAVDRRLGAVVDNRVVAAGGVDDVSTATAVDGVVAGAACYDVGGRG